MATGKKAVSKYYSDSEMVWGGKAIHKLENMLLCSH